MEHRDTRQAEELEELTREAYRAAVDRAFDAQKSGMRLSRRFFENWVEALETHAELNHRTLRGLQELVREQREVFKELARESGESYDSFIESLESYEHELEENATGQGSREDYLMLLEHRGELKRGSATLPDDFWDLPRPEDPEALVRSAVQEDRR